VTRVVKAGRITFAALSVPNYRRYSAGQAISLIGTWMQMTAQSWLVITLTHSGAALGLIVALQTLPVLLLAPYGGVIADRVDKRRLMVALQSAMGVQALALGLLTVTGAVRVWEVGALALLLGVNNAFENPARQSFMLEMVGQDHLRNAVSLNSVLVNAARAIGPAIAGLMIATVGDGVCFLINAASFIAVVASLATLDRAALNPTEPTPRARGQLREGLQYVRRTPELGIPLLMMGAVGCLTYEFQVSLPVMASNGLNVGATGFGFMTAAMGVGAVAGGLLVAARGKTGLRPLVLAAAVFGVAMGLATVAPTLALELAALAFAGGASITFMSTGNSTLQLTAEPAMRGRVMSLWFVAFQGSTPVGGPVVGATMGLLGARAGLGLGAVTCLAVALAGLAALARRRGSVEPQDAAGGTQPVDPPRNGRRGSVELQDAADGPQPVDQPRDVCGRVVHGKRRTRRRGDTELAHQRLRAVVTRADADAVPPEDLPDVVWMGAVERERNQRAAVRGRRRTMHEQSRDL
jgi:MFS family permease